MPGWDATAGTVRETARALREAFGPPACGLVLGSGFRPLVASLEVVVPIVRDHEGHVDKFVGDGVLAVFGQLQNAGMVLTIPSGSHVSYFDHICPLKKREST